MLKNVAGAQWQGAKSVECCGVLDSMTVKGSGMYYINVQFLLLMLFLNASLKPLPSPKELVCPVPTAAPHSASATGPAWKGE